MLMIPRKCWGLLWLSLLLFVGMTAQAQPDCGYAQQIAEPVDQATFHLVQDFGAASIRHEGRFHSGEDWYAPGAGQVVRAVARGRVMYAFDGAWGVDGGVIILEHTLPDDDVFYTQYGHILPTATVAFPQRLTCVEVGQVIGVIASVRPAPHLHFEVRVGGENQSPGRGYTDVPPAQRNYRDPSKYLTNLRARLSDAHAFHVTVGLGTALDETGPRVDPLLLTDLSMLYLDGAGTTIRRALQDGRVLWRKRLALPAVALVGLDGQSLVLFSDGSVQPINAETGDLASGWRIEAQFVGPAINAGPVWLIPGENQQLFAVRGNLRSIAWTATRIPAFVRVQSLPDGTIALMSEQHELLLLDPNGTVTTRVSLRERADFAVDAVGNLLVYSRGGLWRVTMDGRWSLALANAPIGDERRAVQVSDGRLWLFDGTTLASYEQSGQRVWQVTLANVRGQVDLISVDAYMLLLSDRGDLIAVDRNGSICGQQRLFGQEAARVWVNLAQDQILRVAIADQIMGLMWSRFVRTCEI